MKNTQVRLPYVLLLANSAKPSDMPNLERLSYAAAG